MSLFCLHVIKISLILLEFFEFQKYFLMIFVMSIKFNLVNLLKTISYKLLPEL